MTTPKNPNPPSHEDFLKASAFVRTFKTKQEWIEHLEKCREAEQSKFEKKLRSVDKVTDVLCLVSWILLALYGLFVWLS